MTDDLPMDENLRGLLVELSEHPESLALAECVRSFQDLLRPDGLALRSRTGMAPIEAKLLEAHRDELAHLLLQASQMRMTESALVRFVQPRDRQGRKRPVDPAEWRSQASSFVRRSTAAGPEGGTSLLEQALFSRGGDVTPKKLAVASLRLAPRSATRIWIGVHSGHEGDREHGIELQHSVLDDLIDGFHAAHALSNSAWLSNELGRYHDALESARRATSADPSLFYGPVIWFLSAVQVGSAPEASSASSSVAAALAGKPDALQECVAVLRNQRKLGLWAPTAEAVSTIQKVSGHVSVESEQLLQVFG